MSKKPIKSRALSWVYGKTQGERLALVSLIVSNALYAGMSVLYALLCRGLIDSASDHNWNGLWRYALILLAVILVQILFRFVSRNLEERIRARFELGLKRSLFAQILKKNYASATGFHSGELLNRMVSDVSVVSDGVVGILPGLTTMATRFVCALGVLVVLEPNFTWVFLAAGLLVFGVTRLFRDVSKRMHKRVQAADGRVRAFFQEALESLLVIKVFGAEDQVEARAEALQDTHYNAKKSRWQLHSAANAGVTLVFQLGYLFALVWCSYRLFAHTITFGTLTAILQLVGQIQTPLAGMSGILPQYYSMLASAERLQELEVLPDEPVGQPCDVAALYPQIRSIKLDRLSFHYDRDLVLEDADLTIQTGEFVAIMGRSGIGKSTLLKLLLGVFPVDAGEMYFETDERHIPITCDTRALFSYVPQGNLLFSGTIRENLTFVSPDASEEAIRAALKIACADGFLDELPDGLETVIGENGMGLSEGQTQRIAIARAVLRGAPILLLDEATSALDEATEEALLNNLRAIPQITCLLVSHKRAALTVCDRHVWIHERRLHSK